MRRVVILGIVGLVALSLTGTARAASGGRVGTLVVLNGRTEVAADQVAKDVVVFHGRTVIEGRVDGSVVVFDGPTRISGDVRDNVIVFRGRVEVTDGAHIGGDLVTNSTTTVAPGAAVDGRLRHVSNFPFVSTSWWIARFVFWIALTISVLVLGLILVALVPGPMESAARAAWSIGASIGWGFVLLLGLPVAAILVLVTLVGIPLGLSILLALWFLFTVGYTVGLFAAGRRLVRPPGGRMKAFLAGWGVLRAIALVPVLGGIAWTITTLLGLGAIAVAVWRSRRAVQAGSAPSPAPPPRPSAPVPPPAPAGAP